MVATHGVDRIGVRCWYCDMHGAKRLTDVQQRRDVKTEKSVSRKRTGAATTVAEFKRARASTFGDALFGRAVTANTRTVFGVPAVDQAIAFAIIYKLPLVKRTRQLSARPS